MTADHNRLADETSPYLLQHKDNPVHWWPWTDAAFTAARLGDKPIILSVGYSACHWCHVMAHESFEDADIAGLMNRHFVSIKVDREERPDVDAMVRFPTWCLTSSPTAGHYRNYIRPTARAGSITPRRPTSVAAQRAHRRKRPRSACKKP